ncbi:MULTISPECIES: efflux RND transporter periplasmic adaptor subunit [Sphingopyxis]|uniref:Hemolysin D n=1 Tax=Sphingopyxis granuli TaxID=267128 RepID=A0AA86GNM1_9SPHN|nr:MULTISPECIES: efflux RND transporter periplasmic adaptor subunit [Sphingopyxis]AMG76409.1 Hemolysin D [Sphingopyxis granuli]APW73962.1 efflux transporter periplasmic adaptor subunit [Sphingopyxis granuli]AVA15291.1 efflux RND transporter periplasmic adaptor subunit [Sphingopyxis sp. MG]
MPHKRLPSLSGTLVAAILLLTGCANKDDDAGQRGQAAQVGYVVVTTAAVPITTELGGRTVAFETSEVRPQVNGLIRQRLFTEGATVRAGQPLFQIDASLYRAAVAQAEANLASARANAQAAEEKAKRFEPLAKMQAIAEQDYSDALAAARVARAAVAQTAAALDTARINLRYTAIAAPISGRIGRSLATPGALVSANQAEPLAVIQRTDPLYVDIQQSAAELTALRRSLAAGGVQPGSTAVRLRLEDGSLYPIVGTVQFSEVTVNEATGTVTLRARVPNPQGLLLPGMFVTALFEQAVDPKAMLVPQTAVQRDFDGSAFVYLVGKDDKAARRKVVAERTVGADWVVTDGLKPGDRVITQGVGNLRQGAQVKPVPASSPERVGASAGKDANEGK